MTNLLLFVAVGMITYLTRLSSVALLGRRTIPESVTRHLRLIAPATLAAIVSAQLFVEDRSLTLRWDWILAAAVAALVALRWKSAALTMGAGVAAALLFAPLG